MRILEATAREGHTYRVLVGPGALSRGEWSRYTGAMVVYDTAAPGWGVEELVRSISGSGLEARLYGVAGGESLKTLDSVLRIIDSMAEWGLDRWSVLVAYGGGSVSDTAGLAASLYMRGIDWAVAPTTMLGMVDASVGGKTGVNYGGKNMLGSFHHPSQVLVDTRIALQLPLGEYLRGLSEVVKHGVIKGWDMLEDLESRAGGLASRKPEDVEEVIASSLEVKLGVVARDPRERAGVREVLNLGHTVAHALEKATGYRLPHGDAVSIGLVAELRAGVELRGSNPILARRVEGILSRLGLPTRVPSGVGEAMLESVWRDKKRRGHVIRLPIAYDAGDVRVEEVPMERLVEVLRRVAGSS